jgi:chlorobactene glucosyltransferase
MDLYINHAFIPVIFTVVLILIALSNWLALRRLESYPAPTHFPRVSVLIPARNEEANIGACVRSFLAQDYPDFEVVVLDDHSTDRTAAILAELAATDPRLRILAGQPLPDGWLGKHWACHQLSQKSTGELLLFTDADTHHAPCSIRSGVAAMLSESADLLTAIPRQEVGTWAEKLVVPLVMQWGAFAFLPLALAFRLHVPQFSASFGQYMLFRKDPFVRMGGFAAVRQSAIDDLALGRLTVARGYRWRLADATRTVSCRMYRSAREVYEGFSKNLFAGFDYRLLPFIVAWLWLLTVFLLPVVILLSALAGFAVPASGLSWSAVQVILAVALFSICCRRFALPLYLALCYPATIALVAALAFRSAFLAVLGRNTWKGRMLLRPKVRLL